MYKFARFIAMIMAHCWFRLRTEGRENLPTEGPAIFICNHLHVMDVVCVAAMTRRPIRFMAKKELFRNRLVAWFLNKIGTFPISRGDADISGIRTALRVIRDGEILGIFPEGTRNRKREVDLLPLHEGVSMIALLTGAPIYPLWIEGGYTPWKPCRIRAGKPMDLSAYAGKHKSDSASMKKLTGEMRETLLELREEVVQGK